MLSAIIILIIVGLIAVFLLFRKRIPSSIHKPKKHVFGIMSDTIRGERVRSKAEKILADYFYRNKIDYIYEKTIIVGKRKQKIKYDFYLPYEDVYVEYWGMENSSPEIKIRYLERKHEKIKIYTYYKLRLVSIYPDDLNNIDTIFPMKFLTSKNMYQGLKDRFIMWIRAILFKDYQFYQYKIPQNGQPQNEYCVFCGITLPEPVENCNRCGSQITF